MGSQLNLQTLLENTIGSTNVYFQAPETKLMKYPCIKYSRIGVDTKFANDKLYCKAWKYQLMFIDRDPDNVLLDNILMLPKCSFDRHYTSNGLNHDVYNIYY